MKKIAEQRINCSAIFARHGQQLGGEKTALIFLNSSDVKKLTIDLLLSHFYFGQSPIPASASGGTLFACGSKKGAAGGSSRLCALPKDKLKYKTYLIS